MGIKKRRLISFDIDGTMEFGEPPGRVTVERVKKEKSDGNLIGSASDRPISNQTELWKERGIEPDFIVLKHHLADVRAKFEAEEYWHIGDSEIDRFYAERSGFTFFWAHTFPVDGDGSAFEGIAEIEK